MSSFVLGAVLFAALLHATWNSLVKSGGDKFLASALICLWCGAIALAVAVALPAPAIASAPYIVASALVHVVYFLLVARLYRTADLSVAYPVTRGLAPVMAAGVAALSLGEFPPLATLGGALLIVCGVLLLGLEGLRSGGADRATLWAAIANSAIIAVYSVIDAEGARLAGPNAAAAVAFNAWADAATAALYGPMVFWMRGPAVGVEFLTRWRRGLLGGGAAFGGYAIVVWAMTQTTIASVTALRETSVVFAMLIGAVFLGESMRLQRYLAVAVVVAGVFVLRQI